MRASRLPEENAPGPELPSAYCVMSGKKLKGLISFLITYPMYYLNMKKN
jgi:hypothetical protein